MGTLSKSGINAEVRDRMEHLVEPQTNGGIELHRTMADGWAFRRMFLSEPAAERHCPGWLHEYDHHRLHTAIGNHPPSPARPTSLVRTASPVPDDRLTSSPGPWRALACGARTQIARHHGSRGQTRPLPRRSP